MKHLHSFSVGQSVELITGWYDGDIPRGAYTIQRLLPNEGMDREYRVRHQHGGQERVAREGQIRPGPVPPMG